MPTEHVRPDSGEALQLIANAILKARKVVVVTGAGISTNSGIPDFRSENGLYQLIQEQYEAAARAALPGSKTTSTERRPDASNTEDFPDSRPRKRQRVSAEENTRHRTREEQTRGRSPNPSSRRRSNSLPPPSSPQLPEQPSHLDLPSSSPCHSDEDLEISQFPRSKPRASSSGPGLRRSLRAERRTSRTIELLSPQPNGQQDPGLPASHEREAIYAALRTPLKRRTHGLRTMLPLSSSPLSDPPFSDPPTFQNSSPLSRMPQLLSSSPPLSSPPTVLFDPRYESSPLSRRTSDFDDSRSTSEEDDADTPPSPSSPEMSTSQRLSEAQTKAARLPIANLKGRELFDSSIWACPVRTSTFYRFITSLRQRVQDAEPTTSHYFISHLRDRGKLVRCYTQNIDRIEEKVGLSTELARGAGHKSRFSTRKSALSRGNSALSAQSVAKAVPEIPSDASQPSGQALPDQDRSGLKNAPTKIASQDSSTTSEGSGTPSSSLVASGTATGDCIGGSEPNSEALEHSQSSQETLPDSSQPSEESSQTTDDRPGTQAETGTEPTTAKSNQRRQPAVPSSGVECVLLHGSLEKLRCFLCRRLSDWDGGGREEDTLSGLQPECPHCVGATAARQERGKRALGIGKLRPDIVLYGEDHPSSVQISNVITHDLSLGPDLLLILGTSLKVHGLKTVVKELAKAVHSKGGKVVFVNFTKPPESSWGDVIDYWVEWDCDAWVGDMKNRIPLLWLPPGTVVDEPSKKRKRSSGGERKKATARKPTAGKKAADLKAVEEKIEKIESCIVATSKPEPVGGTIAVASPELEPKKPRKPLPTSRPSLLPALRPSPETSSALVRHPGAVGTEPLVMEMELPGPHAIDAGTIEVRDEVVEARESPLACDLQELRDTIAEPNALVLAAAPMSVLEETTDTQELERPRETSPSCGLPESMAVPVAVLDDAPPTVSETTAKGDAADLEERSEEVELCRVPEAAQALLALASQIEMPKVVHTMLPAQENMYRAVDCEHTPPTQQPAREEISQEPNPIPPERQDMAPQQEGQVDNTGPSPSDQHTLDNTGSQASPKSQQATPQGDEGQVQSVQPSVDSHTVPSQEESQVVGAQSSTQLPTPVCVDPSPCERQDVEALEAETQIESMLPSTGQAADAQEVKDQVEVPQQPLAGHLTTFDGSYDPAAPTLPLPEEVPDDGVHPSPEHPSMTLQESLQIEDAQPSHEAQHTPPQAEIMTRVEDTKPPSKQPPSIEQERTHEIPETKPLSPDNHHTSPDTTVDKKKKQTIEPRSPHQEAKPTGKPWYMKPWNAQRNDYVNGAYLAQLIVEDLLMTTGRAIPVHVEFPSVAEMRAIVEAQMEKVRAKEAALRQERAEQKKMKPKTLKKFERTRPLRETADKRGKGRSARARARKDAAAAAALQARSKKIPLTREERNARQRVKREATRLKAMAEAQRRKERAEEARKKETQTQTRPVATETGPEPPAKPPLEHSIFIAESVKTRRRECTRKSMDGEQRPTAEPTQPWAQPHTTTERPQSRERAQPTRPTKRKNSAMEEPAAGPTRRSQHDVAAQTPPTDTDEKKSRKRKHSVMEEGVDPNRRRSKRLMASDGEAVGAPEPSVAEPSQGPLPSPKAESDENTRRRSTRTRAADRETTTVWDLPMSEPTAPSELQMLSPVKKQDTRDRRRSSRINKTSGEAAESPAQQARESTAVERPCDSPPAPGAPLTPPGGSRTTLDRRQGPSFIEERVKLRARRGRVSYAEPETDDEADAKEAEDNKPGDEEALPLSRQQRRIRTVTPTEKNQKMGPHFLGGRGLDTRGVSAPLVEISGNHPRASPAVVEAAKVG